jgi:hypothetical protein
MRKGKEYEKAGAEKKSSWQRRLMLIGTKPNKE